ncbi:MAG: FHA domain-containing protein [Phycisphaera sp.]|nr:FHA domain-containing protein [Phycisphaera sp.]
MPELLVSKASGDLLLSQPLQPRTVLTLGRSERSTIVIPDDRTSRHHAVLFEHRGLWHLADLGSKAGLENESGKVTFHRFETDDSWVKMGPVILWLTDPPEPEEGPDPTPVELEIEPPFRIAADFLRDDPAPVRASEPLPLLLAGHAASSPTIRILDLGDAPRILVGRSGHADLVIDDPAVAPLHAVIYREEDRWAIADAGSETGLRANGRRWLRKILEPGTRLEFGGTMLIPVEPERLFTEENLDAEAPEIGFDPFDFGSAFVDETLQNRPDRDG